MIHEPCVSSKDRKDILLYSIQSYCRTSLMLLHSKILSGSMTINGMWTCGLPNGALGQWRSALKRGLFVLKCHQVHFEVAQPLGTATFIGPATLQHWKHLLCDALCRKVLGTPQPILCSGNGQQSCWHLGESRQPGTSARGDSHSKGLGLLWLL